LYATALFRFSGIRICLLSTGFNRIEGEVLDDEAVAALLRATVSSGSFAHQGADQDFRISIAGAQEKTALLRHEGK
jgi:serine/threonine-protein kinase HipA